MVRIDDDLVTFSLDTSGEPLGRVEILTDVTTAREALQEAHRLADETARLRLLDERRSREETRGTGTGTPDGMAAMRDNSVTKISSADWRVRPDC